MANDSIDFSSVSAAWKNTPEQVALARAQHQRIAQTLALRMEDLTASDEWNIFKAHLETWLEYDRQQVQALQHRLNTEDLSGEEMLRLKAQVNWFRGGVDRLERTLALPTEIQALAKWRPSEERSDAA